MSFVDIAALSVSGSLSPSVPCKILVKFNPPLLTIVYHFEDETDKYFHDIQLQEVINKSTDEIVSHLYVTEAYYLNPK